MKSVNKFWWKRAYIKSPNMPRLSGPNVSRVAAATIRRLIENMIQ